MFGKHAEADSFNTIKAWVEKESSAGQADSCRQCLRAKLSPIGMEGNRIDIVVVYGASSAGRSILMGGGGMIPHAL